MTEPKKSETTVCKFDDKLHKTHQAHQKEAYVALAGRRFQARAGSCRRKSDDQGL